MSPAPCLAAALPPPAGCINPGIQSCALHTPLPVAPPACSRQGGCCGFLELHTQSSSAHSIEWEGARAQSWALLNPLPAAAPEGLLACSLLRSRARPRTGPPPACLGRPSPCLSVFLSFCSAPVGHSPPLPQSVTPTLSPAKQATHLVAAHEGGAAAAAGCSAPRLAALLARARGGGGVGGGGECEAAEGGVVDGEEMQAGKDVRVPELHRPAQHLLHAPHLCKKWVGGAGGRGWGGRPGCSAAWPSTCCTSLQGGVGAVGREWEVCAREEGQGVDGAPTLTAYSLQPAAVG